MTFRRNLAPPWSGWQESVNQEQRYLQLATDTAYVGCLVTDSVPSSPILVTLMKEALSSPKRRFLQEPHGVTSQKTPFFIVTAVKTSNLIMFLVFNQETQKKLRLKILFTDRSILLYYLYPTLEYRKNNCFEYFLFSMGWTIMMRLFQPPTIHPRRKRHGILMATSLQYVKWLKQEDIAPPRLFWW
jgi:hypothetical protein